MQVKEDKEILTKLYLTWYECTRCKKLFLSYFEITDDIDKEFLARMNEENSSKGLFDFVIRGQRECRVCRKGLALDGWMDLEEDFGMTAK